MLLAAQQARPARVAGWDEIRRALREAYGSVNDEYHLLSRLSKVKQDPKKEESLDDFIDRFDAAHQDYAECGEVSAHLTITLFLNGLLPHLAEDIRVDIDSRPDWMRHHDIAPMESAKAITALSRLARSKKTRC